MRNLIIAFVLALFIVACVPVDQARVPTGEAVKEVPPPLDEPAAPAQPPAEEPAPETPAESLAPASRFTIEAVEGDLIQLKPEALDPDGDVVEFTFTKPFDTNGQWQTEIGDEGKYDVVVGASDGKSTTTETVTVIVTRANRPPVVDCREIVVNEGEIVDLHKGCTVSDEDSGEVIVTYSGWMSGWKYQTGYDDAGAHTVTITASDKDPGQATVAFLHTVIRNVTITVRNTNRAPVFGDDFPSVITATENDVITLPQNLVTDPDKDPVKITFSAPFNENGVWKTKIGDAGSYDVDVVATDGESSTKKTVTIKIGLLNTAPVLKTIPDITVKEGETVKLPISATDREGDKLTTTISGWMTSDTYKTTYEDAGSYTVKVTVTDGEFTASQTVPVTVQDVNRPPVFVNPA
jgi:hypothetical protein